MNRRLYRCRRERRLGGVAAGLAEYLDIDVTLVRLAFVVSLFFGGLGLLAYVLLAIVVPLEPDGVAEADGVSEPDGVSETADASGHRHKARGDGLWLTVLGVILIVCGGNALLELLIPGAGRYVWPAGLVAVGLALVAVAVRRRSQAV